MIEEFLAAVAAAPHDHAPRLVFADWLDEAGDADRAAFLRQPDAARAARRRCFFCGLDRPLPSLAVTGSCPDCGHVPPRLSRALVEVAGDIAAGDLVCIGPDGDVRRHDESSSCAIGVVTGNASDGRVTVFFSPPWHGPAADWRLVR